MQPSFRLYDSMTKRISELVPIEPDHLKFYSCGPTVYHYAHIGNFRSFLTADLIVRTAMALGWQVSWVCNITDVGHLTDDDVADSGGEDRMAKGLRSKEGQQFANVWDLADYFATAFKEDWKRLNLIEPMVRPRATQHVREQIVLTQKLIEAGHAYETPTGVYFSVASFPKYGSLSGNVDQQSLQRAVRDVMVDENKRHPADFALWKKDDKHLMQWYSPFGWGFPGWHVECSAMSMEYLGETLDLHSGGEDNKFPHHECEIAQSESLTGKPFANHWVHTKHLQVEGEKMAKSTGNFYTVRDLVEGKGIDPLAVRYALISGNYRQPLNFTMQGLRDAMNHVERFKQCSELVETVERSAPPGPDTVGSALGALYEDALEAMCSDLNTPVAFAKALEGARLILREGEQLTSDGGKTASDFLHKINGLLGVVFSGYDIECPLLLAKGPDDGWIDEKITARAAAKAAKDYATADAIRAELDAQGVELRDGPDGTTWKRKITV